ncbi:RNA polymerase sigma factor [Amycolatopsis sp. H20-H5]|uniref:RNA polymerase sigma factor n=1 Tax=Amycolatopsis sp. H20-H5 TaxID=3046309 RepID=UPI002DBC7CC0|nr:RNA polymerase sigma factor [Amycolatopsis sp. H20-H5]MEC3981595.1 RNA polymerase sigma factor [Amycolatopsis sp. H20-H5]
MKQTEGTAAATGGTASRGRAWPADRVISAAREGDARAIAALVVGSYPHVQRFARSLCSTPQDAEDAAQEAVIVLFRQIGTLRATAALSSWLFRIVRHECLRRARLALRPAPAAEGAEPSAESVLLERLETERVVDAIAALPLEQRAVLVLRDVQGYSGAATAEALGLSRAAMKSRLHRARRSIREHLLASGSTLPVEPHPPGSEEHHD